MVDAVDDVADIMHIARDPRELAGAVVVSEFAQHLFGEVRHARDVRKAVLGKPQRTERVVRAADVGFDLFVVLDVLR